MRKILHCLAAFAYLVAGAVVTERAANAQSEGGSTQVKAQDGCLNQWMFNGMWRFRATAVQWQAKDGDHANGWIVTQQWGNGTAFADMNTNMSGLRQMYLVLKNGDTLADDATVASMNSAGKLSSHDFAPSAQFTYDQVFASNDALDQTNKPVKLLVIFDTKNKGPGDKWWTLKTPAYNYRIDLTCMSNR